MRRKRKRRRKGKEIKDHVKAAHCNAAMVNTSLDSTHTHVAIQPLVRNMLLHVPLIYSGPPYDILL